MLGKNHLLIGTAVASTLLLAAGVTPAAQPGLFAAGLLAGGFGALLPDIDSPNTRIRTSVGLGSRQAGRNLRRRDQDMVMKGLNVVRFVLARLLDIVAGLLPHRGITHWAVTWLGMTVVSQLLLTQHGLPAIYGWLFSLGYGSHLAADSLTPAGIPFFAPLYRGRLRLLPRRLAVRTGSHQERLAVLALLGLLVAAMLTWPPITPGSLADGPVGLLLADLLF
jgi:membrane-bound metal-dependent hydrolase YbcI (DUF457 family)